MEYLQKLLLSIALPPGGLILLALLGLFLAWREWRGGKALVLVSLVGLWLLATPAVSDWLRHRLESEFPPRPVEEVPNADAIVVLGGGLNPPDSRSPLPDLGRAADRYWHAARLWHAGKAPEIVVSGGALPWRDARGSEAEAAVRFLGDLGVPPGRILLEPDSLDTRENAAATEAVLRTRGARSILLVTSALHMRRALARFEIPGVEVIPVATDHEVGDDPPGLIRWLPDSEALDGSRRALKEMIGYFVADSGGSSAQ
ncbi:MAG: YdcF family protein [Wenzhouxiangellaceae bacterium]|nr:YdcF family protein [Wenzhouxiangellaceae bacterium]